MYDRATVAEALSLSSQGLSNAEIGRMLGVDRSTVRVWLRGQTPRTYRCATCAACRGAPHAFDALPPSYVYLLGLYLGDGCISAHARGVYRLRVVLDVRYPGIIDCAAAAMGTVRGGRIQPMVRPDNCIAVCSYWRSWPCLLPQHGLGKKHERPILLTGWQTTLVERWPDQLLRGLIHSDGCRFQNTGRCNWSWPRYSFTNHSTNIREIFCRACDLMEIHWTSSGAYTIYVSRKADVATLDEFIGPKR